MDKLTPIQEDGTTEYFKQLTKYNKYGKNKNTFHDKSKSESIPDQIKQLYSLLDEKDKAQLIAFLAGSHSIGEEMVNKIKELSLDERFNGHYHAGAAMMKEMILKLLNNKQGI